MITLDLDGLKGIIIQPFSTQMEREKIVLYLLDNNMLSVGFIDIAPTNDTFALIKLMDEQGIKIDGFFDHHENEDKQEDIHNAKGIYEIMDKKENFRYYPRFHMPAAAGLVENGEAESLGLKAVLAHYDADGFCSSLKLSHLGHRYPWFTQVAVKSETSNGGLLDPNASKFYDLFHKGMNLGPPYQYSPKLRNIALQDVYYHLALWLKNGMQDYYIADFISELEETNEISIEISDQILQNKKIEDGIVYADAYSLMKKGKRPNMHYLKKHLFQAAGDYMLVAIRVWGHLGDQISIFKSNSHKFKIQLKDIIPPDGEWRVDNRAHLPTKYFELFKKNWLKASL